MHKYLYRVNSSDHSLSIEIGIFDPNRWTSQPEGERGGMSFSQTAEVWVTERYLPHASVPTKLVAEVSQASAGSCDTTNARGRLEVYAQAIMMADFINDALTDGERLLEIGRKFKSELATDPKAPATEPFRYGTIDGAGLI